MPRIPAGARPPASDAPETRCAPSQARAARWDSPIRRARFPERRGWSGALVRLRCADRRELVGHPGQDFGDMPRLYRHAKPGQLAGDVQQAPEIAGEHRFGPGPGDVFGLVADHFFRDVRILDAERAAET